MTRAVSSTWGYSKVSVVPACKRWFMYWKNFSLAIASCKKEACMMYAFKDLCMAMCSTHGDADLKNMTYMIIGW